MQNKTVRIPLALSFVSAGGAAVLRLIQLLFFTDDDTGLVLSGGEIYSYWIYGLLFVCGALCLVYALLQHNAVQAVPDQPHSGKVRFTAYLTAAAFFCDFIHQCSNCFHYIEHTAHLERNLLVSMVLVAVFALLSSFYFFIIGLTFSGMQYDFRSFRLFHFVTVLWAFTRLLGILIEMVSVSVNTEIVCEFIYLVFLLMFFFSYITAAVSRRNAGRTVVFFALASFLFACVLTLPRLLLMISGHGVLSVQTVFTCTTDLACGCFAVVFVRDLQHRSRVQPSY